MKLDINMLKLDTGFDLDCKFIIKFGDPPGFINVKEIEEFDYFELYKDQIIAFIKDNVIFAIGVCKNPYVTINETTKFIRKLNFKLSLN